MPKFLLKYRYSILDVIAFALVSNIVRDYGWGTAAWFIVAYIIVGTLLEVWYETKT